MNWYHLIFIALSFFFSLAINALFLKFSTNLGIREYDKGMIRWTSQKPAFGGISFYIVFLISNIAFSFLLENTFLFKNVEYLGFMLAVSLGFLTGLFDDAFNTKPLLKLLAQIFAGIVIVLSGTVIQLFDAEWLNVLTTIFWVVAIMNAVNLLDNMDAIATITVIGILLCLVVSMMLTGIQDSAFLYTLLGIMSALLGFLIFNWHPSKLFMGDTGSMFLGVSIAFLGIKFIWNLDPFLSGTSHWMQLLAVIIVFILPLTDTTTVFFKRMSAGKSPFIGGKDHTTHHLVYVGLSERQVAYVFAAISLLNAFVLSKVITGLDSWNALMTIGVASYIILVSGSLFVIALMNRKK